MIVLFDSSVLIPSMARGHEWHTRAEPWLARVHAGEMELVVSAHSLCETYAGLTAMPLKPRVTSNEAKMLIDQNIRTLASIRALTETEYFEVVESVARLDLSGGIIYDAIIASVAKKANVDHLVTFNPKHFRRVWPEGAAKIVVP